MEKSKNDKTNVALLGCGRTGKVIIDSILEDPVYELDFICRLHHKPYKSCRVIHPDSLKETTEADTPDVLVDFTNHKATIENLERIPSGSRVVLGTTGFSYKELETLKYYGQHLKLLYAPNISDGINVLLKACKLIRSLMPTADIVVMDEHFKGKKDAPSGTGKRIAEELGVKHPISVRAGGIVGVHKVMFVTGNQQITIEHMSFSRQVFADATKRAIEWISKVEENGFYDVTEVYQ